MRLKTKTTTLVVLGALSALVLAGCSSTTGSATGTTAKAVSSTSASGASSVRVTLTSGANGDVCTLSTTKAAAGPVTFTVVDTSSTAISEVELLSAERILGEKENLAPGLGAVSFTTTLTGGTYQIYCPNATTEQQDLTVSGTAATPTGGPSTLLQNGADGYATYVDDQVATMVTATAALNKAVDSGDLAASKKAYAEARPYYERIETDVDGFVLPGYKATDNAGNLDYLIDMRASNLDPAVGWHGFHAVERDLFARGRITASTRKLSTELLTNVTKLKSLVKGLSYKPEDLANGASGLLEEVQSEKIKGEEEKFSHIDLVDFAANVEGAQQAFAYLKPGLEKIDSSLTDDIDTQFSTVLASLKTYEDPKALGGYERYTPALRAKDASSLSQTVQALQDPLSTLAQKVATAG